MAKKTFDDIYNEISATCLEELEFERKKENKTRNTIILIGFIIVTIVSLVFQQLFIQLYIVIFIIAITVSKIKSKYTKIFKEKVITTFVKSYDENLQFDATRGINSATYVDAEFERHFDRYSCEDLISGTTDDDFSIMLSEVHTENEHTDEDGHTHYTTLFHGLFGCVTTQKNVEAPVTIHSDKGFFGKLFKNKTKIEMDSAEFEKQFDVCSENKIVAMQILTSDVMNFMLDFKEKYKTKFEITLKNNKIYIRFYTGDTFEPSHFKNSLDKDLLLKYYNIINFTIDFCKLINKTVKDTEI